MPPVRAEYRDLEAGQLPPQGLVDHEERRRNDLQGCVALDQITDPPSQPARCRGTDF